MPTNFKLILNYSESDNTPSIDSGKGWIDNFQRFLALMLHQVIGSKPQIVLAPGGQAMAKGEIDNSDAMVCIISPNFLDSPECLDSLESFYQKSRNEESTQEQIFKVMKSPMSIQEQPMRLREMIGYEMFHFDEETQEAEEFQAQMGEEESQREFWMKMVDLVYDIHETYIGLKGKNTQDKIRPIGDKKTVYLAETAQDLTIQRNIIKRELQRFGFNVLPARALPPTAEQIEKQVKKDLKESSLSIHLVGSSYGAVPDGAQRSTVDIQNQIAADWSKKIREKKNREDDTVRFIWISPNLRAASERQMTFVENVKRDIASLEGAEILQTPLEDFKNIIREELFADSHKSSYRMHRVEENGDDKQKVYIIHDKVDQPSVDPIKNQIEKLGYSVLAPSFQGNLLDLREDHIDNLRKLDFALIYQGHVNDQWVRMKLLDLMKAPGFGRRKPILNKGVVISSHSTGNFENLNADKQVEIIHEKGKEPPVSDLQKFLQTRKQVL
jgi:hypothetical protein